MNNAKPDRSVSESSLEVITEALKDNPGLFQDHPELLELIVLSDNRGTASLLERQMENLKAQLDEYKSHHSKLINVARENEQISDSLSSVISKLIGFRNLSEFATEFPAALRTTFEIDEVAFKTNEAVIKRPTENEGYAQAIDRLVNQKAVCDNRWPTAIMKLFFSDAIQSAALIPMLQPEPTNSDQSDKILGIIALGSVDKNKYTNNLGTVHLDKLGVMTGICINRLQPKN